MFTGDLTVTQKIPDSISQGSEALVEITINKNDITGFAKVQQVFPEGFTAEPVETKGATFSFKDNKIKFIWMALPSESEFTISYKLKPNVNTSGTFTLGGKFSFISESERKNIDIPPATFSVVSDLVADEAIVDEPVVDEPVVDDPVVDDPVVDDPVVDDPVVDESNIKCVRKVDKIEDGKYKITLVIDKKGIQGFAKITEQIPDGFTAFENESKGGVFSFKGGSMKVLWMAIPKEDKYSLIYNIEAKPEATNGKYTINGYFSYLENDITGKYDIAESDFELNIEQLVVDEPVIDEPVIDEPVVDEPVVDEPVVDEPVVDEPVADEPTDLVVDNTDNNKVTSTPNPESGISYKVQVGAGHKKVSSDYFSIKFKLKDKVSTINHEGWIKYLVGSYSEYKLARDKRNIVRNNVKTSFVTAYNTGKRITVQEALMISNQKWYK
jgi:hypothetical protein